MVENILDKTGIFLAGRLISPVLHLLGETGRNGP